VFMDKAEADAEARKYAAETLVNDRDWRLT